MPAAPPVAPPFVIPWWLLAGLFFLVEARVIHLHIGRSAHSFSMSELPLVAGLFLVAPAELLAARVVGSGLALVIVRGQRSVKLALNLALFGLGSVAAVFVGTMATSQDGSFGPMVWLCVYAATLVDNVIGVLAVSTAISLSEGAPQYWRIPEMLRIGAVVSTTNTSLALMGMTVLWVEPSAALLFIVPVATATLAYRAYVSERQQHESIQLLYESSRILQRNPNLDSAMVSLLDHARKMFRAEMAEICLLPRRAGDNVLRTRVGPGDAVEVMQPVGPVLEDPLLIRAVTERQTLIGSEPAETGDERGRRHREALVSPLVGESHLIGTFRVSDRLSEISSFDTEDLKLFETLANHAAVALENGQLEKSLVNLAQLKEELHHQASHDSLTGLANRGLFSQVVAQRLESPHRTAMIPVVLFMDLDDFKLVNDSLGHTAGDALLIAVGERIRAVLRADDVAARIGGDEFAILLWDEPDMQVSMRVASRLVAAMEPSFALDGQAVGVRASIGVAAGRAGIETAGDLIRNADVAMYAAKARGKGRVVVFESSMHDAVMNRAQLSADLERAIAVGEFRLQYQPIVEIATGRVTGAEALVRWDHPTRGRVEPDDFIRVAEESETILGIGRWVLIEACRQAHAWQPLNSGRPFPVSVNISAKQLAQPDFVNDVLATVKDAAIHPSAIILEVTETAMLQDTAVTRSKLQALQEAGIGISVDDFGTGYSSLSYLQQFPVTALKIARDFVDVAGTDPEAWELASAIIALGRALRLSVIAEGVEQRSQLTILQSLGCAYAQGFYFARPLDPPAIESLLMHGGVLSGSADADRKPASPRRPRAYSARQIARPAVP